MAAGANGWKYRSLGSDPRGGPQERSPDEVERLHAEGDRRDARTMLLAVRLLERGVASSLLKVRAAEATGDRLGIHRPLSAFVLALVARDAPVPQGCQRVLKHVAHVPELVEHVRAFLSRRTASERFPPLTGWEDAATCFYADLLDAEGLTKIATHYNLWIDDLHVVPFLEAIGKSDPGLQTKVLDALVERQSGAWEKEPNAVLRDIRRADGSVVQLWGSPSPTPVNRLAALWP